MRSLSSGIAEKIKYKHILDVIFQTGWISIRTNYEKLNGTNYEKLNGE
jgi:hypothetical protein